MAQKTQSDFHGKALMNRDVDGFALLENLYRPGARIPKHSHERAHLGFVLRRTFEERCENRTLECTPLSVSFLGPGMTHSDDFDDEVQLLLVGIAPHRLQRLNEALPLEEPVSFQGGRQAWLGIRLHYEACQTDAASSLAVEGLILEILAEVSKQPTSALLRKLPLWLARARELLHAQFMEDLTHQDIAEAVSVHPVHLAREFRRFYGCTVGEYVRQLRIGYACREIATSDAPLVEIALSAGFADQSHFSKVFKRLVGMSPAEFRNSTDHRISSARNAFSAQDFNGARI